MDEPEQLNGLNYVPEHIDDLIAKLLCDEATADELKQLESWAVESPDHSKYLDQFRKIYDHSKSENKISDFDADGAWTKVSAAINAPMAKTKVIEHPAAHRNRTVWMRIAAAVTLLIAGTFLVYQVQNKDVQPIAVVATDVIVTHTLPDGSKTIVNKGSSLAYVFDEDKKTRTVKLEGEAYFEVKHNEEETFVVETQGIYIQDIGTIFNVKNSEDGQRIEVQVKEGEVKFFSDSNSGINLIAGETGLYNLSQGTFEKLAAEDENMSAWADHDFNFRNSPLRKVVKKLNEVYDIPIELSSEAIADCQINVKFRNIDIHEIADIIAETLGLEVIEESGKIILSGESCQ